MVVDLSRVELRHLGCVAVFGAAVQQAGGWPDAKLALLGANPRMLTHLARCSGPAVPVADSHDAALVMADQPPRYRIHRVAQLTQLDVRDPETAQSLRVAIQMFTRLTDAR
jgi:hypothetical protein